MAKTSPAKPAAPKTPILRIIAALLIVPALFPALLALTRALVQQDYSTLSDDIMSTYTTYFRNYDNTPNVLMIGVIYLWEAAIVVGIWILGRKLSGASFLNTAPIFLIVAEALMLLFSVVYFARIAAVQHISVMRAFSVHDMIIEPHIYNLVMTGSGFVIFWLLSGLPWLRGALKSPKPASKPKKARLGLELS